MDFDIDGLQRADVAQQQGVTLYTLSSGATLAIAHPPADGDQIPQETHEVAAIVRSVGKALATIEQVRRQAASDITLSDIGRQQTVLPARKAAAIDAALAEAAFARLEQSVEALRTEVHAPPALARDDLEAIMVDQEIRRYARGLNAKDRAAFAEEMGRGDRYLHAVLRSPVPMPVLSDYARRLWDERVVANNPRTAKLAAYDAAIAWARPTITQIRAKI